MRGNCGGDVTAFETALCLDESEVSGEPGKVAGRKLRRKRWRDG